MKKTKIKLLATLNQKLEAIQDAENGMSIKDVAKKFKMHTNTIYHMLRLKNNIRASVHQNPNNLQKKRIKPVINKYLDDAVAVYANQCRNNGVFINGPVIQAKARQLAVSLGMHDFRGSSGWLMQFLKRHGFTLKDDEKKRQVAAQEWLDRVFKPILEVYQAKDIFYVDATAVLYGLEAGKSFDLKGDKCLDDSFSKTRLTLLLSCNMDGTEKLKPMVVGNSVRPESFKGVSTENLPVYWESNKQAWMTVFNLERWLLRIEELFQKQNRKVLMFSNHGLAHPKQLNKTLKFIQLEIIPFNMITTNLQPMKMGIFRCVKLFYRHNIIKNRLAAIKQNIEYRSPTVLECIRNLARIWECDVTPEIVGNYFQKSGFTTESFNGGNMTTENILLQKLETQAKIDFSELQEHDELAARDCWEDYVNIDQSAAICDVMSDDEILAYVGKPMNDQNESDEDDRADRVSQTLVLSKVKILTVSDMKMAIQNVHRTLQQAPGVPGEIFQCLNKIDNYLDIIKPKC